MSYRGARLSSHSVVHDEAAFYFFIIEFYTCLFFRVKEVKMTPRNKILCSDHLLIIGRVGQIAV